MSLTITRSSNRPSGNYLYGVATGATWNGANYFTIKNNDTSNAIVLKSFTFVCAALANGYSYGSYTGTGGGFTMTATCNGKTSAAVTVNKTYTTLITSDSNGQSYTLTFSDPPTIAAGASQNLSLSFANTTYYSATYMSFLLTNDSISNNSATATYENSTKSITLTIGTGVSSATATGGTTGSKTWTSGGQAFAGVAWNGNVKLTARTLATGYHDGTNTTVNKTFTANATLTAVINTYTVQYYDGSTNKGSSSHTYGTAKALNTASSMSMSKSGWTFAGWTTSTSSTTVSYTDGQSVKNLTATNNGTVTLYAIWKRSATFYSGASKATTNTVDQFYNSKGANYSVAAPAGSAITGWTKLGFRNDTTAGAKEYDVSSTITASSTTYYAVYSRSVTLTYTNGGGTGTAPTAGSATQYYNSNGGISSVSFTLASNTFTRTGYTFSQWAAGNAGATYTTTPAYSTSGTQALTTAAQWTGVSYSVAFNAHGGTGTMTTQTGFVYGTGKALTANGFTAPSGYSFYGWATSAANANAGTRKYTNSQSITDGTTTSGGTVTLYAIWYRQITFYHGTNKAANTKVNQYYSSSTSAGAAITTPAESTCTAITNWTKLGWRDDTTAGAKEYSFAASITPSSVTTYYATYSATLTFYSGYNKATTNTATGYYNSNNTSTVSAPAPTAITNWTVRGWRADTTASDRSYAVTTATTMTGFGTNVTFYHVYSQAGYVTYANGGGTGTAPSNTTGTTRYLNSGNTTLSATGYSVTLAANTFTRSGYTFNGWSLGAAGATYSWTVTYSASPNKTATAQWTGISYSVKFNANGGSGTMSNETGFVYGTAKALTANAFTAPTHGGYSFNGWATSTANATAGTVAYADGANMTTGTTTSGGTVNLYAVWKRTCTFYSGASKGTTNTATQYYGGNVTFPSITAISNWSSLGYRDDTTAGAKEYDTGAQAYTSGNTLYAVYSRTLTVSYNGNSNTSGSTTSTTKTVYLNSNSTTTSSQSVTLASNGFVRTNYVFKKWAEGSTSGTQYVEGASYNPSVAYDASTFGKTMYAIWYAYFYWTNDDTINIATGQPTRNITAAKWNEFNELIATNWDSNYTYTTVTSGQIMTKTLINQPATKLGVTIESDNIVRASYFNSLRDKYNKIS